MTFVGGISGAELKSMMRKLNSQVTDDEIETMIRLIDTDGDGEVPFIHRIYPVH